MNFSVVSAKTAGPESSARSYLLATSQTTTLTSCPLGCGSNEIAPSRRRRSSLFDNRLVKKGLNKSERSPLQKTIHLSVTSQVMTTTKIEGSGWKKIRESEQTHERPSKSMDKKRTNKRTRRRGTLLRASQATPRESGKTIPGCHFSLTILVAWA